MHIRQVVISTIVILAFLILPVCHFENKSNISRARLIVDQDLRLQKPILELMSLTGISPVYRLKDAITNTQSHWLRPAKNERIQLSERYSEKRLLMLKHFESLGLLDKVEPKKSSYNYVFLLGAMYETFRHRMNLLEQIMVKGIKFKKLVLLGSHRPLEQEHELDLILRDYPNQFF